MMGSMAQNCQQDKLLMLNQKNDTIYPLKKEIHFGISNNKSPLIQYNPIIITAAGFMFFYQSFLSRQLSATCGFNPSCSDAGKNLIKKYGFFKGIFCTADRLTRCNKISFGDVHRDEYDKHDHTLHEDTEYYE